MIQEKKEFDIIYEKLCQIDNCLLSIYNLEFSLNLKPEDFLKSNSYQPIFLKQRITKLDVEYTLSVFKNLKDIYFYIESNNFMYEYKLLFDATKVNMKELNLILMNLKKEKK